MASNADIKQHISTVERAKWNKNIADLNAHVGAGGVENHRLGNRTVAGFSEANFSPTEQDKLESCEWKANYYIHPDTHPYTMITGLSTIAHTGNYIDIQNRPATIIAVENGTADAATVSGGIRITIGPTAPSSPKNSKEVWFDTANTLVKIYQNNSWISYGAVYK